MNGKFLTLRIYRVMGAALVIGGMIGSMSPAFASDRVRRSPRRVPSLQTLEAEPAPNDPCTSVGVMEWINRERIVFISRDIDGDLAERVTAELLYLDAQAPGQDIYLVINSPGGEVSAGLAILDVMRSLRSDITTITIGQASSMASILLAAGTKGKRMALPNARVMIHQPLDYGVGGQASDIAIEAKEILLLKNKLNQILATITGQPLPRIEVDTDRNFYLSAQEAKAYGLVDKVIQRLPFGSAPAPK